MTRAFHKQGTGGSVVYKPGQDSKAAGTITETPTGYGWATDFLLAGDLPAGRWTLQLATKNNHEENGPAYVGIAAFSACAGGTQRLFFIEGSTDAATEEETTTYTIPT